MDILIIYELKNHYYDCKSGNLQTLSNVYFFFLQIPLSLALSHPIWLLRTKIIDASMKHCDQSFFEYMKVHLFNNNIFLIKI